MKLFVLFICKGRNHGRQFISSCPPAKSTERLRQALSDLEKAQRNAVLWFAEVVRRKVYRELGYSSIYQYAELELGFKKSQDRPVPAAMRFLKGASRVATLCGSWGAFLDQGPGSGQGGDSEDGSSLDSGGQDVAASCTGKPGDRDPPAGTRRASGSAQATLEMGGGEKRGSPGSEERDAATPVDVHVRMTAEQYARYQALMEALTKGGAAGDKAERILAGLEQLALGAQESKNPGKAEDRPKKFTRGGFKFKAQHFDIGPPKPRTGSWPSALSWDVHLGAFPPW